MTLSDLPQEVQQKLINERVELCSKWHVNDSYHVSFTNKEGTRYFSAERRCINWCGPKGGYMPFGGGTYWTIKYGKILFTRTKQKTPFGVVEDYEWCKSQHCFGTSHNGVTIPNEVATKSEVIAIAKAIGILVI